jgi:hypothetical protein
MMIFADIERRQLDEGSLRFAGIRGPGGVVTQADYDANALGPPWV